MNNMRFYKRRHKRRSKARTNSGLAATLAAAAILLAPAPAASAADAPDWLRAAARISLPDYPDDTEAVILLDEQVTTVSEDGEIRTRYRRVYKILRPAGRSYGTVIAHFDNETRLTTLKAWSLLPNGETYEVKKKDAVERSYVNYSLYTDSRYKRLRIPAAEPGNVIGYEYEQIKRPFVLQDWWMFAQEIPVRQGRFVLELPEGWEFKSYWMHHPEQEPQAAGRNRWMWEMEDVAPVKIEPAMPPWGAVAGHLAVSLLPARGGLLSRGHSSWNDIGRWYAGLVRDRRRTTPGIQQKVAEITGGKHTPLEKIRALTEFIQRNIRYVSIGIGIGGYQPHRAEDVFAARYGDCKDKATLLSTMLREIGVDSYYALARTERGVVVAGFPSIGNFDHVILVVRLPEGADTAKLYSLNKHPELGDLVFFDPTDEVTPFGYLPPYLQANSVLLVGEDGGELVDLGLHPANTNRLLRKGKFVLKANGDLQGEVQEIRWGAPAVSRRRTLLRTPAPERVELLGKFLADSLSSFSLQEAAATNLKKYDQSLILRYRFVSEGYAEKAGSLLFVRPRVLGRKRAEFPVDKERTHPVAFSSTSLQTDLVEIVLPEGYRVDELPPPVELTTDFAEYHSRTEVEDNVLRYQRRYEIKEVRVPAERLPELKRFFQQVAGDERSRAVLKLSAQ